MKPLLVFVLFSITLAASLPFEFDFNVAKNEAKHHTTDFKYTNRVDPNDDARMLVRRGDTFTVFLADDEYPVTFQLIPYDVIKNREFKTPVTVKLVDKIQTSPTMFQTVRTTGTSGKTQYDIYVPFAAPVSMYHWVVVNGSKATPIGTNELAILFNPWCTQDDVYSSDPNFIKEYVMNEDGVLWYGSANSMGSMGWDYAQFDYAVLEVTLYFLSNVQWDKRGDIVTVSRALSSWVNVNDNNGLVWGRWSGSYDDGKSPMYWTGSQAIYAQYRSTLGGVKYGQCWVFGGCLTSAGRSIGIPARTLTNFESAHESPNSNDGYERQLDMFFDASGSYLDTEGGSIWNFHVWCEFWMKRADLSSNYAGWQAVDATPQERSDGLMQMGPASVNAIQALDTKTSYDSAFVASEVGCAVTKWIQYDTGKQQNPRKKGFWLLETDPTATGLKMSTKAVGTISRNDITSTYKHTTMRPFPMRHRVKAPGITFEIVTPTSVTAGQNFSLTVVAECPMCSPTSMSFLEITGLIRMMTYTGDQVRVLRNGTINVTLDDPHEMQSLTVLASEYIPYFKDNYMIEYHAFVKYYEKGIYNGTYALKSGRFDIKFPPLTLTVLNVTDDKFYLTVQWTNPLGIPLSRGILRISGAYVADQDTWIGNVAPYGTVNAKVLEVYHFSDGEEILVFVKFLSTEIPTLNAQTVITPP